MIQHDLDNRLGGIRRGGAFQQGLTAIGCVALRHLLQLNKISYKELTLEVLMMFALTKEAMSWNRAYLI